MQDRNPLYPIFLKLHELRLLIVGAGEVGYEKMSFILKSSPDARITLVAPWVNPEISSLLKEHPNPKVTIHQRAFEPSDVKGHDLVIAATNIQALNLQVRQVAKAEGKLINVADTPDQCDFYLGSIVTKGNLKVAISTNGQSPTFAKRFRQVLEDILPDDTTQLLNNLKVFRDRLKGDFSTKVEELNALTADLLNRTEIKN